MLEIRYPVAIIEGFHNYAFVQHEWGERYAVELRLVPPEDEIALPQSLLKEVPGEQTLPE